jgi:hypothetical protein
MQRRYINSDIRNRIYKRDNLTCVYCKEKVYRNIPLGHFRRATLDHVVSLFLGGSNDVSNLVTCCFRCNLAKSKHLPTQFPKLTDCKQFQNTGAGESLAAMENNMPSYKDAYESKSKFLKVDDLEGKKLPLTITGCDIQSVGEDKKLVLSFHETEKTLVLNVTNARMLEMLTGSDDYTQWVGNRIILRRDIASFNGKPTPCIRIDSELAETPARIPQAQAVTEEIPF